MDLKEVLTKVLPELLDAVDVNTRLLSDLRAKDDLPERVKQQVSAKSTNYDKVEVLMDFFMENLDKKLWPLICALRKNEQEKPAEIIENIISTTFKDASDALNKVVPDLSDTLDVNIELIKFLESEKVLPEWMKELILAKQTNGEKFYHLMGFVSKDKNKKIRPLVIALERTNQYHAANILRKAILSPLLEKRCSEIESWGQEERQRRELAEAELVRQQKYAEYLEKDLNEKTKSMEELEGELEEERRSKSELWQEKSAIESCGKEEKQLRERAEAEWAKLKKYTDDLKNEFQEKEKRVNIAHEENLKEAMAKQAENHKQQITEQKQHLEEKFEKLANEEQKKMKKLEIDLAEERRLRIEKEREMLHEKTELAKLQKYTEELKNEYREKKKRVNIAHEEKLKEAIAKQAENQKQQITEQKQHLEKEFEKHANEEQKKMKKLEIDLVEERRLRIGKEREILQERTELAKLQKYTEDLKSEFQEKEKMVNIAHEEKLKEAMAKQAQNQKQQITEQKQHLEKEFEKHANEEQKKMKKLEIDLAEERRLKKEKEKEILQERTETKSRIQKEKQLRELVEAELEKQQKYSEYLKNEFMETEKRPLGILRSPQCLIGTEDGKLKVSGECIGELKQLNGKLVVVAIVGLYRTGKSYLMNRLARQSSGFSLGTTIGSKTKGIWIWARKHPTKKDTYLVLLDTEGLGDAEKGDPAYDNRIFTLALLLSSTLIYNLQCCINEDVISKLTYITDLSKNIKMEKDGISKDSEFDLVFPQFVLALRDFTLRLQGKDGKPITANQYLERLLDMKAGKPEEYNRCRRLIRKYFRSRTCFTFPPPASPEVLQKLEDVSDEELSPVFRKDTKEFMDFAFDNFAPMKLHNGHSVSGRDLAVLTVAYVDAINDENAVPCIESACHQVVHEGNDEAINQSVEIYSQYMHDLELPLLGEDEMSSRHKEAMDNAKRVFNDRVVVDDNNLFKKFNEKVETVHLAVINDDKKKSTDQCRKVLEKYAEEFVNKLNKQEYIEAGGYYKYKCEVEIVEREYRKHARGVSVGTVWSQFLGSHSAQVAEIRDKDEQLSEKQKKAEEAEALLMEEKRRRELEEMEKEAQRKYAEEMKNEFIESQQRMAIEHEKKMKEVLARQEEINQQRMAEKKRLREEGFKQIANEERENIEKLMRQHEAQVSAIAKEKEDLMNTIKSMESTFHEMLQKERESFTQLRLEQMEKEGEMKRKMKSMETSLEDERQKIEDFIAEQEAKGQQSLYSRFFQAFWKQ